MNWYPPASSSPPPPARGDANAFPLGPLAILQLVCSTLIVMGSFGTWARVDVFGFPLTITGVEDGNDGVVTLALAVVAAVLVIVGGIVGVKQGAGSGATSIWSIGTIICFTLAGALAGYSWMNVSRLVSVQEFVEVSVGWGLLLTLAASVAGLAISIVRLRQESAGSVPVRR